MKAAVLVEPGAFEIQEVDDAPRPGPGEVLVRIDGRDYRLALRQSGASVDKAELDVRLEKARKEVAKAEWEVVDPKQTATDEGRTLALREPQLQAAQDELLQKVKVGDVLPTDLVWKEGMGDWKPLSQVAELAGSAPAPPTRAPARSGPATRRSPAREAPRADARGRLRNGPALLRAGAACPPCTHQRRCCR